MSQTKSLNDSNYIYKEVKIEEIKTLLNDYEVEVESPDGFSKVVRYVEKGPKLMFNVLCNGHSLNVSYDHLFETNVGWILTKDLDETKHKILCDDGLFHDFKITYLQDMEEVVDIEVDNKNHRYFTDGLSSHNTNIGKTLVMCSLATNLILNGFNVLYVTFEDNENKIASRIAQNMFDVTQNQYKHMTLNDFNTAFSTVKNKLKTAFNKLIIKEYPEGSINALTIKGLLKDLNDKKKFKPDIIFIDYIGCMIPNGRPNPTLNTNTILQRVAAEIRSVGMEFSIPIISASQTNRGGYGAADINLNDAADSFSSTMKADAIFGFTQTEELKEQGMYQVKLLKTRYGNLRGTVITIGVDVEKQRIYDLGTNTSMNNTIVFNAKTTDQTNNILSKTLSGSNSLDVNDDKYNDIEI